MIYEAARLSLSALQLAAKNRRDTRVWREARSAQVRAYEEATRQMMIKASYQERVAYYQIMTEAAVEKARYFREMQDARLESYRLYWAGVAARLKAYSEYQRLVQEGVERYRAWKRKAERDLIAYRSEQRQQEKKTQAYRLAIKREAASFLQYTRELAVSNRKIRQAQIRYTGRKSYGQVWGRKTGDDSPAGAGGGGKLRAKA